MLVPITDSGDSSVRIGISSYILELPGPNNGGGNELIDLSSFSRERKTAAMCGAPFHAFGKSDPCQISNFMYVALLNLDRQRFGHKVRTNNRPKESTFHKFAVALTVVNFFANRFQTLNTIKRQSCLQLSHYFYRYGLQSAKFRDLQLCNNGKNQNDTHKIGLVYSGPGDVGAWSRSRSSGLECGLYTYLCPVSWICDDVC